LVETDGLDRLSWDGALTAEALVEGRQLFRSREVAVDEEVADLLEARLRGQIMDVVAAVEENAPFTVDVARLRAVEVDVLEALVQLLRYHDDLRAGLKIVSFVRLCGAVKV